MPAFLLAKACVKLAVSPATRLGLTVGTPVEVVPPSYILVPVTAVTVIGLAMISPVMSLAKVTA